MSDIHPDPETLARYVRGELGRDPRRELERHLMGCSACQKAADEIQAEPGQAGVVRWLGHRFEERRARWEDRKERKENLGGVMRGLGNLVGAFAEKRVLELLRASEHERRALIRDEAEVRTLPVCELLEARCREAWLDDPEEAVELAKLALRIAERLDPGTYGAERVEHAKALAWVHLGNSYRIASAGRRPSRPALGIAEDRRGRSGEDDAYPEIVPRRFSVRERPAASTEAETALWELRDAFLERGLGFDAALVTLELAMALLRQGREGEVRDLAVETVALFEEREAQPYATDAMRFLRDAALREGTPLRPDLLVRMVELLQHQRNDPRHRKDER